MFIQGTDSEGNLCNVTQAIPIDMSVQSRIVEHLHIGQNFLVAKIKIYMALSKVFRDVCT